MADTIGTQLRKANEKIKELTTICKLLQEQNEKYKKAIENYVAEHDKEIELHQLFTMECAKDIATIACKRTFNTAETRTKRFDDNFDSIQNEYFSFIIKDSKDDKDLVYSRKRIDDELELARGKYFEPWDIRHTKVEI